MVLVTQEIFFATVGKMNVHPTPIGKWDDVIGYKSLWKLRDGTVVGESDGATEENKRYWVIEYLMPQASQTA